MTPSPEKEFVTREEIDDFKKTVSRPWGWQAIRVMERLLSERDAFEKVAMMEQINAFGRETNTDVKDPAVLAAILPETRRSIRNFARLLLEGRGGKEK